MKRMRSKTIVIGVIGATMLAGVAFAAWTATGSGSGAAKAASATASTISAGSPTADLYPGQTAGDLYISVNNPNPYDIRFTSGSFGAVTSGNEADCPASNVTVDASASGLTIDVPAGSSGVASTIADVVSMANDAPNACQGVTFTIAVTLSGTQQ
jgi:hypothetical protein